MTLSIISLGCPKNQVDGERMLHKLDCAGFKLVPDPGKAEIVLINTCGFINSAKEESIETIIEVGRLKKEGKVKLIILTGCLAERYINDIADDLPEVDVSVGIGSNDDIVEIVQNAVHGKFFVPYVDKTSLNLEGGRILNNLPFYAYLKIAEGCSNCCSYCAIPLIRGEYRSRPLNNILQEAKQLVMNGVSELILVAQDTTRYGEDLYGEQKLPELLENLCEIEDLKWIRLLYCYPERITEKLLQTMKDNDKIVRYLDIPIQHIDDDILKRMNRNSNEEQIRKLIFDIKAKMPDISLRTSLIAGFPGETEDQFAKLMAFVKEADFDHLGCFAYSQEEDTPAAEFPDQIPEEVKDRRTQLINEKQDEVIIKKQDAKIGKTFTVVVEGFDHYEEMYFGRSQYEAPEIDGKIFFKTSKLLKIGEFIDITVTQVINYDIIGIRN